ncbi:MAG: S41 family peptidase [Eubacteriales bacterium]
MKRRFYLFSLIIVLFTTNFSIAANPTPEETGEDVELLIEFILENYSGSGIDEEMLYDATVKGLFDALDPYSDYYTEEEYEELYEYVSSSFYGIGAQLQLDLDTGYTRVIDVLDDSPAEESGLLEDDLIIGVDEESVKDLDLDLVVNMIKGDKDTPVILTVKRGEEQLDIEIIRGLIRLTETIQVDLEELYANWESPVIDKTEYVVISKFNSTVADDFARILYDAISNDKEYLVLDLRNNPGGYVDQVVEMCDYLVPEGPVLYTVENNGTEEVYNSTLEEEIFKEIVVLTNNNSASASEILASAIQESGAGIVAGEQTYGKGTVQQLFSFKESGFKLTIAEYFSRDRNKINNIGVIPNIEVKTANILPSANKRYKAGMTEDFVKSIEEILRYLGYFSDTPDRVYDKTTEVAIKRFQAENDLYPYGICDFSTQSKLNEILLKSLENNDRVLERALYYLDEYDNNFR